MRRRDFLKLTGLTGTLAATGCSPEPSRFLIPFLNPPKDIIPGIATWYATTCRQCPAGCGMLARNREARVVKFEGNPEHPVNRGKLCARGQAALQDLYSPDRLAGPRKKEGGTIRKISWEEALGRLYSEAESARGRVAILSGLENGMASHLLSEWLGRFDSNELLYYEAIDYEDLREGNRLAFGTDSLPSVNLADCDFLLSISCDFLETWLSPVEFARQFAQARDFSGPRAGFLYAGPRLSLTAANADRWIPLRAGTESAMALALLKAVVEAVSFRGDIDAARASISKIAQRSDSEALARRAGVDPELVRSLARRIARSKRPLVLADRSPNAVLAANLVNLWTGTAGACLDFSRPLALSKVARRDAISEFLARVESGEIHMLVIHRSNPAYSLPGFERAVAKVPFVAVLDSIETETSALAHLALPLHSPYESWGSYSPREGLSGLLQPAMGPVTNSKPLEWILGGPPGIEARPLDPSAVFRNFVGHDAPAEASVADQALEAFSRGFASRPIRISNAHAGPLLGNLESYAYKDMGGTIDAVTLVSYPSLRWFDGRDANKTWMLEIPDPLSMITWGDWLEVHPDLAKTLGLDEGRVVKVASRHGEIEIPVHLWAGLHPNTVAAPVGLGHRGSFGRFAGGLGAPLWTLTGGGHQISDVRITPTGRRARMASVDGSSSQHSRGIAQAVDETGRPVGSPHQAHKHDFPLRLPVESAHDPKIDIYPVHGHAGYRWGMVIDLDRCIGCSACVAACYAENNIPSVGRDRILEGREMAWLRIERYLEPGENPGVRFLPMLCQHCDNAPCEAVCPVYAPHHDPEGLNTQIYNRCIGTRFCVQNCPYKVRRFNFFKYRFVSPLHLQLNPDVTVRTKGVMEKCSFCVQRIKDAHQKARKENRLIRDGEVVPACAQTCPTGAISFGSYLDPESTILRLAGQKRAYQVLGELNTKPAVIYLKKILRSGELGKA